MMQRLIHILWPSFLVAGAADILFTTLLDPLDIVYRGEPLIEHRIAAYTLGFFFFWLICIASSAMTCYFQSDANKINRCPLPPQKRPEDCPKGEGKNEGDCC